MNICFIMGKIVSNIEFKFIIKSKNYSIIIFKLELRNKSIIQVKAYNELADFGYQNLKVGEKVFLQGMICNDIDLNIDELICTRIQSMNDFSTNTF